MPGKLNQPKGYWKDKSNAARIEVLQKISKDALAELYSNESWTEQIQPLISQALNKLLERIQQSANNSLISENDFKVELDEIEKTIKFLTALLAAIENNKKFFPISGQREDLEKIILNIKIPPVGPINYLQLREAIYDDCRRESQRVMKKNGDSGLTSFANALNEPLEDGEETVLKYIAGTHAQTKNDGFIRIKIGGSSGKKIISPFITPPTSTPSQKKDTKSPASSVNDSKTKPASAPEREGGQVGKTVRTFEEINKKNTSAPSTGKQKPVVEKSQKNDSKTPAAAQIPAPASASLAPAPPPTPAAAPFSIPAPNVPPVLNPTASVAAASSTPVNEPSKQADLKGSSKKAWAEKEEVKTPDPDKTSKSRAPAINSNSNGDEPDPESTVVSPAVKLHTPAPDTQPQGPKVFLKRGENNMTSSSNPPKPGTKPPSQSQNATPTPMTAVPIPDERENSSLNTGNIRSGHQPPGSSEATSSGNVPITPDIKVSTTTTINLGAGGSGANLPFSGSVGSGGDKRPPDKSGVGSSISLVNRLISEVEKTKAIKQILTSITSRLDYAHHKENDKAFPLALENAITTRVKAISTQEQLQTLLDTYNDEAFISQIYQEADALVAKSQRHSPKANVANTKAGRQSRPSQNVSKERDNKYTRMNSTNEIELKNLSGFGSDIKAIRRNAIGIENEGPPKAHPIAGGAAPDINSPIPSRNVNAGLGASSEIELKDLSGFGSDDIKPVRRNAIGIEDEGSPKAHPIAGGAAPDVNSAISSRNVNAGLGASKAAAADEEALESAFDGNAAAKVGGDDADFISSSGSGIKAIDKIDQDAIADYKEFLTRYNAAIDLVLHDAQTFKEARGNLLQDEGLRATMLALPSLREWDRLSQLINSQYKNWNIAGTPEYSLVQTNPELLALRKSIALKEKEAIDFDDSIHTASEAAIDAAIKAVHDLIESYYALDRRDPIIPSDLPALELQNRINEVRDAYEKVRKEISTWDPATKEEFLKRLNGDGYGDAYQDLLKALNSNLLARQRFDDIENQINVLGVEKEEAWKRAQEAGDILTAKQQWKTVLACSKRVKALAEDGLAIENALESEGNEINKKRFTQTITGADHIIRQANAALASLAAAGNDADPEDAIKAANAAATAIEPLPEPQPEPVPPPPQPEPVPPPPQPEPKPDLKPEPTPGPGGDVSAADAKKRAPARRSVPVQPKSPPFIWPQSFNALLETIIRETGVQRADFETWVNTLGNPTLGAHIATLQGKRPSPPDLNQQIEAAKKLHKNALAYSQLKLNVLTQEQLPSEIKKFTVNFFPNKFSRMFDVMRVVAAQVKDIAFDMDKQRLRSLLPGIENLKKNLDQYLTKPLKPEERAIARKLSEIYESQIQKELNKLEAQLQVEYHLRKRVYVGASKPVALDTKTGTDGKRPTLDEAMKAADITPGEVIGSGIHISAGKREGAKAPEGSHLPDGYTLTVTADRPIYYPFEEKSVDKKGAAKIKEKGYVISYDEKTSRYNCVDKGSSFLSVSKMMFDALKTPVSKDYGFKIKDSDNEYHQGNAELMKQFAKEYQQFLFSKSVPERPSKESFTAFCQLKSARNECSYSDKWFSNFADKVIEKYKEKEKELDAPIQYKSNFSLPTSTKTGAGFGAVAGGSAAATHFGAAAALAGLVPKLAVMSIVFPPLLIAAAGAGVLALGVGAYSAATREAIYTIPNMRRLQYAEEKVSNFLSQTGSNTIVLRGREFDPEDMKALILAAKNKGLAVDNRTTFQYEPDEDALKKYRELMGGVTLKEALSGNINVKEAHKKGVLGAKVHTEREIPLSAQQEVLQAGKMVEQVSEEIKKENERITRSRTP